MADYHLEGIKLESFLGPLEARLLETLWTSNKRPVTVREIHQLMTKDSKIAYTTVIGKPDWQFRGKGDLLFRGTDVC